MRVWRLVRRPYADLSGTGASLFPGRWNEAGQRVVYTAEHRALAVLEVRVHLGLAISAIPPDYVFMEIELGSASIEQYGPSGDDAADKAAGIRWLQEGRSAILAVPSVLVAGTLNYLINPLHPEAITIQVVSLTNFTFDPRIIAGTATYIGTTPK